VVAERIAVTPIEPEHPAEDQPIYPQIKLPEPERPFAVQAEPQDRNGHAPDPSP